MEGMFGSTFENPKWSNFRKMYFGLWKGCLGALLRIPSEVISKKCTSDYGRDVWESGWGACIIVSPKLSWGNFRRAWVGGDCEGKKMEMKWRWWLCETNETMEMAQYVKGFLVKRFLRSKFWSIGLITC